MSSIIPYLRLSNKLCFEEIGKNRENVFAVITLTTQEISRSKFKIEHIYGSENKATFRSEDLFYSRLNFDKNKNPFPQKIESFFNTYVLNKDNLEYYEINIKFKEEVSFFQLENIIKNEEVLLPHPIYSLAEGIVKIASRKNISNTEHNMIKFVSGKKLFFKDNRMFFQDAVLPMEGRGIEVIEEYIRKEQ